MSETLTVGLTKQQRELLLRGLRFVRSSVVLEVREPSTEVDTDRATQCARSTASSSNWRAPGPRALPLASRKRCVTSTSPSPPSATLFPRKSSPPPTLKPACTRLRPARPAGRAARVDDGDSRTPLLPRGTRRPGECRDGPPRRGAVGCRPPLFRRTRARLGLPRPARAGDRQLRPSRDRPAARRLRLRHQQRVSGPAQRRGACRRHD